MIKNDKFIIDLNDYEDYEAFIKIEVNNELIELGFFYGKHIIDLLDWFYNLPFDIKQVQQEAIYINSCYLIDYNKDANTLELKGLKCE